MVSPLPSPDRRIAARADIERSVLVATEAGEWEAVTVNVSSSGMLVALAGELTIWAEVAVMLPEIGRREARVARRDGGHYGLVFREPLSPEEFARFAGVAMEAMPIAAPLVRPKRAGRTAPWAFGRDRLKTLKREAAARAEPVRL